jgi:hypothetical protein
VQDGGRIGSLTPADRSVFLGTYATAAVIEHYNNAYWLGRLYINTVNSVDGECFVPM